jgi:hypothetical protein
MPPPFSDSVVIWTTSGSVKSRLADSRQALLAKSIDYSGMFAPCSPALAAESSKSVQN